MPRELLPPEQLLKPRDEDPILYVPPQTWHCLFCDPNGPRGARTTVVWLSGIEKDKPHGPHGRCGDCGQKFELSTSNQMKLRDGVPAENLDRRIYFCRYYPTIRKPEEGINVNWRKDRGHCEDCGQNFKLEA